MFKLLSQAPRRQGQLRPSMQAITRTLSSGQRLSGSLLRSHARPRGPSIGAAHISAFRVIPPSEAQMPDKIPQSDCEGDVAAGRDTGFPKHGAMLRIGARGKRGAARWGVRKLGAYSTCLQFWIDPSLHHTRMRQGTCPANHKRSRCSGIGFDGLGGAQSARERARPRLQPSLGYPRCV